MTHCPKYTSIWLNYHCFDKLYVLRIFYIGSIVRKLWIEQEIQKKQFSVFSFSLQRQVSTAAVNRDNDIKQTQKILNQQI